MQNQNSHSTGAEQSWQNFLALDPENICSRTGAVRSPHSGNLHIRCFNMELVVDRERRQITGCGPEVDFLLKSGYFFDLALLWYLCGAREIVPTGNLIKPEQTSGGQIYVTGTHVLPLQRVSEQFGDRVEAFLERGKTLGAEPVPLADAALRLSPFPRLPMTLLLWKGDDEFAAEARLLFDDSCQQHLTPDALWAVAMTTILLFCRDGSAGGKQ